MPTPLESFMEALQKRRMCEAPLEQKSFTHTSDTIPAPAAEMKCEFTLPESQESPPVSSRPAHTHTLEGFANTGAGMKCETKCEGSLTLGDPLQAGMIVQWDSPLFGLLAGMVLEVASHTVTVFHPLGEHEATIPRTWVRMTAR